MGTNATAKRILALIAVWVVLFTACGGSDESASVASDSTPAPPSSTQPASTTETSTTTTPLTSTTARPTTTAAPTTTIAASPVVWTPLTAGPVHDDRRRFGNPGAIIIEGGTYHMFANMFESWPGEVAVRHLTSGDGIVWEEATDVVLSFGDSPYDVAASLALGGHLADDGTWNLYFHTYDGLDRPSVIGRASAPDPDGPWTIDPEPVLTPGGEDSWDSLRISRPSVVEVDGELWMYYSGWSDDQTGSIGLATSTDGGSTWTKTGDPVLTAQDWEQELLERPEVAIIDGTFVMIYQGGSGGDFGIATSTDGLEWNRPFDRPAFRAGVETNNNIYQGELVSGPDGLLFYIETGLRETNLYGFRFDLPTG